MHVPPHDQLPDKAPAERRSKRGTIAKSGKVDIMSLDGMTHRKTCENGREIINEKCKGVMAGLIRIIDQIDAGKHMLLLLDADRPQEQYSSITIECVKYDPIIPYGAKRRNCIAIDTSGNFVGKEIKFV